MDISSLVDMSGYLFLANKASSSWSCWEVKWVLCLRCLFFLPSLSRLSLWLSDTSLLWLGASPGSGTENSVKTFYQFQSFNVKSHVPLLHVWCHLSWLTLSDTMDIDMGGCDIMQHNLTQRYTMIHRDTQTLPQPPPPTTFFIANVTPRSIDLMRCLNGC